MRLYAFGSNGSGQLGIGSLEDTSRPKSCEMSTLDELHPDIHGLPSKIVAGGNATYVLFDDKTLYRAGKGATREDPQHTKPPWTSTRFERTHSWKYRPTRLCASTWAAAIFVEGDSKILAEGAGPAGELGNGSLDSYNAEPKELRDFFPAGVKIIDISSSVSHTVVVLSNGEAWGWGNGRKGQLGEDVDTAWECRQIGKIGFKVVRAVCGREFTFLVGEPSGGRLAVLGSDKWNVKSRAPKDVKDWQDIGASWGSLYVLDGFGKIKSWGRNDRGQLAPPDLPAIEKMAVGSEHVVALTREGKVVSWGWGEHGNCGDKTDDDGNVNGTSNEISLDDIEPSATVLGVGAGCATSFIWTD